MQNNYTFFLLFKNAFSNCIKGIFLIACLFFNGCVSNELEELPFFKISYERTNFGDQFGTIELVGKANDFRQEALDDHGFVWSTELESVQDFPETATLISKGNYSVEGEFMEPFQLKENEIYFIRAYGKLGERTIYSNFIEKVSLNEILEIDSITVFNDQAQISGTIRGLNENGPLEEYGVVYSETNQMPMYDFDEISDKSEPLFSDLAFFLDTIRDLDFNKKYYCRIYGKNQGNIFYGAVKEFEIKDGWKRKTDFPSISEGAFGFSNGTDGFVGFGATDVQNTELNNYYDLIKFSNSPTGGSWASLNIDAGSLLNRFTPTNSVFFEINGIYYAGLGSYEDGTKSYHSALWVYDPNATEKKWEEEYYFPGGAREHAVAFVVGNKAYIGGGNMENTAYNDFYEFDPSQPDPWKAVDPIPQINEDGTITSNPAGRVGAVAFNPTGSRFGYVGMGHNGGFYFNDIWRFDPTANGGEQWSLETQMPGPKRAFAIGFSIENKAYVIGGFSSLDTYLNDVWEYDFDTETWYKGTSFLGSGRQDAIGFSIGNKGYFGMGKSRMIVDNAFKPDLNSDFWEYTPRQ